jgi:hypothetical protein
VVIVRVFGLRVVYRLGGDRRPLPPSPLAKERCVSLAAGIGRVKSHRFSVIDFLRTHPDEYEPAFEIPFEGLIQKLDPPSTG